MSKRFRDKHCTYCVGGLSTRSGDHVFARKFFLTSRRDHIPKVPCCLACNNEKSKLEHYLSTVLPFGASHADALEHLAQEVPRRLKKNLKLHRALVSQAAEIYFPNSAGVLVPHLTVPMDTQKLERLFVYITKALADQHFQIKEHEGVSFEATLDFPGIDSYIAANSNPDDTVCVDVGEGTFIYRGTRSATNPTISAWEYTVYGGLQITGCASNKIVVFTGPSKNFEMARLRHKFGA